MTDKQLPTNQATPGRRAKWGKVAAAVSAGIVIAAIIGLILVDRAIADSKGQVQADSEGQAWTDYITDENSVDTANWVQVLTIDPEGRVWAGTEGGELKMITPDGQVTTYTTANSGLTGDAVSAVAVDDQGRVWVGTEFDGLNMLAPDGTWKSYKADDSDFMADWVRDIVVDAQGRVWIGTSGGGVRVLEPDGSWTSYTSANSGLGYDIIETLAIDGRGQVWVGTTDNGIHVLASDGSWTTYTTTNSGLQDERLNTLATDQQGRVWVAAAYSGISVVTPDGSWKHYSSADYGLAADIQGSNIETVAFDNQGRVWIGATYGGFSMLTANNQWTTYTPSNSGLPYLSGSVLAIDQQDRIWVGHVGGLGVFDPNAGAPPQKVESLTTVKLVLTGLSVAAFALMLIVLAAADVTPSKKVRQFVIGFIGWPVLNAIAGSLLGAMIPSNGGLAVALGWGFLAIALLALTNIGVLIYVGRLQRWWMLAGMVSAFIGSIAVIWILRVL